MPRMSKKTFQERLIKHASRFLVLTPVVLLLPLLSVYLLTFYRHILSNIKTFILPFLLATAATFILTFLLIFFKDQLNVKDRQTGVPLLGGLAIYTGFGLALFSQNPTDLQTISIFCGATIIFIVGLLDDIFSLSSKIRLLCQFAAALIVISSGLHISFFAKTSVGIIGSYTITVFWIIGIINAMNFFDGMDGLAAGIAISCAVFFFLIATYLQQFHVALMIAIFIGCGIGFIGFNFKPAKIYLGDAGSTFFGFMLACFALYGGWANNRPLVSLGIPVSVLSVLIFDMIYITISRIARGRVKTFREWLDYRGEDHLHHRLRNLGFRDETVVFIVCLLCVVVGLQALQLEDAKTLFPIVIGLVQIYLIYSIIAMIMLAGRKIE